MSYTTEYGKLVREQAKKYKLVWKYYDNLIGNAVIPDSDITDELNKEILGLLKEEPIEWRGYTCRWYLSFISYSGERKMKKAWVLEHREES